MSKIPTSLVAIPIVLILTVVFQAVLNKNINYKCGKCGKEFGISPFKGAWTPHSMGRKLVTCPSCGKRTWATPMRKNR